MGLDENLPTFFVKPHTDAVKHHQCLFLCHHGSEPEPTYDFHLLDPSSPRSRNVYAAALYDSYTPDVLFAEVLVKPTWTQPTLSQDEIRKNGGVPPPPQPLLPTGFTLQLYNPDQQIVVTQKSSNWTNTNWYEFSMPQETFRYPSASALDRSRSDPMADPTVTKMNFMWKRDSKLSKDMTCFLTGKSTDAQGKKKGGKEADIAVALFKGLKEITIYESNFHRVEMEDYKGLEVVLLLSALVIRDVFFGQIKEVFHINDPVRKNSGGVLGRKNSSPIAPVVVASPPGPASMPRPAAVNGLYQKPQQPQQLQPYAAGAIPSKSQNQNQNQSHRKPSNPAHSQQTSSSSAAARPPPIDPRSQWEIDAETARLRQEELNKRREQDTRRRQKERSDEEEQRRIRRMLEIEEKERRRKQAEVDKETERLRRKYGTQGQQARPPPSHPLPHRHSVPSGNAPTSYHRPVQRPSHSQPLMQSNGLWSIPQGRPAQPPPQQTRPPQQGPYLQAPAGHHPAASQSSFFGGGGQLRPDVGQSLSKPKRSFLGLRNLSEGSNRLMKKSSSMF